MSIRKRYDEAQDLIDRKLYEPALILLLVAVAAAAERYRKHHTGGASKKRGDDRKWFVGYVNTSPTLGLVPLAYNGNRVILSEILYEDLRCELIHEAELRSDDQFSDAPHFVKIEVKQNRAKLMFGIELLSSLADLLKHDPLGREDFRDMLTEFDNIVEYDSATEKEAFKADLINRYDLSEGRYQILETVITALKPEPLSAMDFDDMAAAIHEKLLPNLAACRLNAGALTGLRWPAVLDENNRLTQFGYEVLAEMSQHYRTVDAGSQPA